MALNTVLNVQAADVRIQDKLACPIQGIRVDAVAVELMDRVETVFRPIALRLQRLARPLHVRLLLSEVARDLPLLTSICNMLRSNSPFLFTISGGGNHQSPP